ncbi:MAG: Hsp20/alpha crystallin family protein [Synechococcaceae cyanobacterium]|nr:Hsp20/alpha crystallin family protein [Synechococcaceae cyanobacterium]
MLTRRSFSAFELLDRLEQHPGQQLQRAEGMPAAEVHDSPEAYAVVLELPGFDKAAISVNASERTLSLSAVRRSRRQPGGPPAGSEAPSGSNEARAAQEPACSALPGPLLSEFRYGTWSRSFRFPWRSSASSCRPSTATGCSPSPLPGPTG